MSGSSTVEPRLLRGFRDLLPEQMAARQRMIEVIRGVYELYGFVPLGTPALEYLDVLTGSVGQETNQSIFRVTNPDRSASDQAADEHERLGLRFDLTVPLARVVSQYRDLPRPFRRYQVSSVWRADKPDRGRFREFTQFDLDSVGVASDLADTEIIAAMCDTLSALEAGRYRVRYSSRRILGLLLRFAEVPDFLETRPADGAASSRRAGTDVFRVLDKLDKLGSAKVRLELTTGYKDESGDAIAGLGLESSQVDRIERFLAIQSERRDEVLGRVRELFAKVPDAAAEIDVLARISDRLGSLGYGDDRVALDLSVARGLAYYTGPVFEAVLLDAPEFGSVFGGGRYDDLVMRFLGESIPATGASIGVDRLLAALVELKRVELRRSTAQVLVTTLDPAMESEYLRMTFELRRAGIRTELYLGGFGYNKAKQQLKYADQQQIPLVVLCGGDEKAAGVVKLKQMDEGRKLAETMTDRSTWLQSRPGEIQVPREELVESVCACLPHNLRVETNKES